MRRQIVNTVDEVSIAACRHCGSDSGALCCPPNIAYYETQRYRLSAEMVAKLDRLK